MADDQKPDQPESQSAMAIGLAIGAGVGAALIAATGSPVWIGADARRPRPRDFAFSLDNV